MVSIRHELLTCEVFVVAEFVDAEQPFLRPFILSAWIPGVRSEQIRSSSFECSQAIHTPSYRLCLYGDSALVDAATDKMCDG